MSKRYSSDVIEIYESVKELTFTLEHYVHTRFTCVRKRGFPEGTFDHRDTFLVYNIIVSFQFFLNIRRSRVRFLDERLEFRYRTRFHLLNLASGHTSSSARTLSDGFERDRFDVLERVLS